MGSTDQDVGIFIFVLIFWKGNYPACPGPFSILHCLAVGWKRQALWRLTPQLPDVLAVWPHTLGAFLTSLSLNFVISAVGLTVAAMSKNCWEAMLKCQGYKRREALLISLLSPSLLQSFRQGFLASGLLISFQLHDFEDIVLIVSICLPGLRCYKHPIFNLSKIP